MQRSDERRHELQRALVRGEERFRLLIESVREYAIFMLDRTGHVESWNLGAQRLKGYSAADIIGRHFSVFYPPEDVASGKPARELEIATATGQYEEEGWRIRKDGSRLWANVVITALRDETGDVVGFGKVTRDMTERRAHQELLRDAATELERRVHERTAQLEHATLKLEATNAELEAFGYSVSHDLRAPLRALDGFSKRVLASAADRLTDSERGELQRVRAAAQRMAQLIDDLLNLSRLTRTSFEPKPIELGSIAREVCDELRRGDPGRDVEVVIDDAMQASADPRMLRIVLENLIGNAWKFSRGRPRARIEVGCTRSEGRTVYHVRDDGVGFDPKYAGKLFFPFQRLHSAREFEGTGIGLATVQRIVRGHGGEIWATSAPGSGATFSFTLESER
ncbi:MAG: PAS domain S-box protein [Deltaproteobacteria bacterium]|nr:PAS domain S-box protein [Deltaproteobacteria bacterium]